MKKIVALILVICMVLPITNIFAVLASAEDTNEYSEAWSVFKGLKLISFSDEQKEEPITRGEFAAVIANALRLVSDEENVDSLQSSVSFGKPENSEGFADTEQSVFSDVPDFHHYYNEIKAIVSYGIMKGDGNGAFKPDEVLKYEEALKTFVSICGYDTRALIDGGWFIGYYSVAKKIDILLDNKNIGQQLTKCELLEIFYRVFDVEINYIRGISGESVYYESLDDKTFLTEYMDIGCIEGKVTAVETTTLTAPIVSLSDTIVVDGKSLYNRNDIRTSEYLGRTVKAYYDLTDGVDTLLYITYSSRDEVIVIEADDIEGYANGTLTYLKNNHTKNLNIKNLPVIYNGTAKTSYTKDIFDFQFGDVTITDTGKNDVVIIRDYKDMIVSAVSLNDSIIYGEGSADRQLKLDRDTLAYIYSIDGERLNLENLSVGLPITYLKGENYVEIWACPATKTGVLNSLNVADKEIVIDGIEYILSNAVNENKISGFLGKNIKIYCNKFGAVFRMELANGNGEMSGYLVATGNGRGFANSMARIFKTDGKFEDYTFADKFTLYKANSSQKFKASGQNADIAAELDGYTGFVTYKVNGNNEINMIQIPYENRNLKSVGDGRIWTKKVDSISYGNTYNSTAYSIGTQIFFDASVAFFSVPTDGSLDDYQMVNYLTVPNLTNFGDVCAYYSDFDDPIPDAVVVKDWSPTNARRSTPSNLAVVTELVNAIDKNGEPRKVATVVDVTGVKTEIYSDAIVTDQNGNECTVFDAAKVDFKNETRAVDVGDIIAYITADDQIDNVINATLIYDCSLQNIEGGKKGYLAAATLGSDLYYTSLNIDYLEDDYHTASEMISSMTGITAGVTRQNPIRIYNISDNPFLSDGHRDYNNGRKFMLGYVAEKTDAFVYLTTQDLSLEDAVYDVDGIPDVQIPCPTDGVDYTGIYWQEWFKYVTKNGYLLTIEYYDRGVEVRKGVPADIYSYEDAQNESSRILADPMQNRYYIINDYRTR